MMAGIRIITILLSFSKEEQRSWAHAMKEEHEEIVLFLEDHERNTKPIHFLASCFTWDSTREGHNYWEKIDDRVQEFFNDFQIISFIPMNDSEFKQITRFIEDPTRYTLESEISKSKFGWSI